MCTPNSLTVYSYNKHSENVDRFCSLLFCARGLLLRDDAAVFVADFMCLCVYVCMRVCVDVFMCLCVCVFCVYMLNV